MSKRRLRVYLGSADIALGVFEVDEDDPILRAPACVFPTVTILGDAGGLPSEPHTPHPAGEVDYSFPHKRAG